MCRAGADAEIGEQRVGYRQLRPGGRGLEQDAGAGKSADMDDEIPF
jgi:hypothetical protein